MQISIETFLRRLQASPGESPVFNPWWHWDSQHDRTRSAPRIRRAQLRHYLNERLGRARYALIGEALGYQGGHFTGIPMTSERILLGYHRANGIDPAAIFSRLKPRRTSRPALRPRGYAEPTATLVWGTLLSLGLAPSSFVLWNAFPWHPFDRRHGLLSNRRLTQPELSSGVAVMRGFLALFPHCKIIALGQVAASQLRRLEFPITSIVRHPASGGARAFREQIKAALAVNGPRP